MPSSFTVDFHDRVVCVTGGATGIGAASAAAFARAGAHVVIADIDRTGAERTAAALTAEGAHAVAADCDVSREDQVVGLFDRIVAEHGRIDIVHANAGLESMHPAVETSLAHWQRVIGVNLTGVFLTCRSALRHMYRQGSGCLVITSSPHATETVPDAAAYTASKGAVQALMRSLALDAAPRGIRVNALVPGTIDTPMIRRELSVAADPEDQLRRHASSHPLGRLGTPEEVAAVALFLCSDAASFVTGACVNVDGGLTAALPSGPGMVYNT